MAMNSLKPVRQRAVTPSAVRESADDEQRGSHKNNQQCSFCHGVNSPRVSTERIERFLNDG
jgi:mono/diheme cytochrome c family protein